ncbi:hypothetical protein PTKIN_Ptkin03bG0004300 [Pterospermum kingtungense]
MLDRMIALVDESWRIEFERVGEYGFSRLQGLWVLREIVCCAIVQRDSMSDSPTITTLYTMTGDCYLTGHRLNNYGEDGKESQIEAGISFEVQNCNLRIRTEKHLKYWLLRARSFSVIFFWPSPPYLVQDLYVLKTLDAYDGRGDVEREILEKVKASQKLLRTVSLHQASLLMTFPKKPYLYSHRVGDISGVRVLRHLVQLFW